MGICDQNEGAGITLCAIQVQRCSSLTRGKSASAELGRRYGSRRHCQGQAGELGIYVQKEGGAGLFLAG